MVNPETAGVVIASILGLSGVIITAIFQRGKSATEHTAEMNDRRVCGQHSGMMTDITNIKDVLEEVRNDIKYLLRSNGGNGGKGGQGVSL